MNVNKVSGSNRMWQGHEEVDVIAPCKEKLQMLLSCCQDVAQIVETLEAHMQSSRPKESTVSYSTLSLTLTLRLPFSITCSIASDFLPLLCRLCHQFNCYHFFTF